MWQGIGVLAAGRGLRRGWVDFDYVAGILDRRSPPLHAIALVSPYAKGSSFDVDCRDVKNRTK